MYLKGQHADARANVRMSKCQPHEMLCLLILLYVHGDIVLK